MKIKEFCRKSLLEIGWKVGLDWKPLYWDSLDKKPGKQNSNDLVTIKSDLIAEHTAIIAQSGFGKSYFLGRLIEEILTKTSARCIIFDPNSDYIKVDKVTERIKGLWEPNDQKIYNKYTTEDSRETFSKRWENVKEKKIYDNNKLRINWLSIESDTLAEGLNPIYKTQLYLYHNLLLNLGLLAYFFKDVKYSNLKRLLTLSQEIIDLKTPDKIINKLDTIFDVNKMDKSKISYDELIKKFPNNFFNSLLNLTYTPVGLKELINLFYFRRKTKSIKESIILSCRYIKKEVQDYYSSKLYELTEKNIVRNDIRFSSSVDIKDRLCVYDLPSIKHKDAQLTVVSSILHEEFVMARDEWEKENLDALSIYERRPTFLIVDEAHNLIPANTLNAAQESIRERFRTIVSEGRKFGLFLIIVTQRPDKVDPQVLSECENKVLMKLSSQSVLNMATNLLNAEDVPQKLLSKCLELEKGKGILWGKWAPEGPQKFHSAARRTEEGGKSLEANYWSHLNSADISYNKGVEYVIRANEEKLEEKRNQYLKKAIESFKTATKENESYYEAFYNLSIAYHLRNNETERDYQNFLNSIETAANIKKGQKDEKQVLSELANLCTEISEFYTNIETKNSEDRAKECIKKAKEFNDLAKN